MKKCLWCGTEFEKKTNKKYCSVECRNFARFGKTKCVICGKEIQKTGRDVKHCSMACVYKASLERNGLGFEFISIRSDKKAQARFVTIPCGKCGKHVEKRVGDHRRDLNKYGCSFCSNECARIYNGQTKELICSECGKDFHRGRSEYNNYNSKGGKTFCSRVCKDKNIDYILRGADHYNYVDGESKNHRGYGWKRIRKEVRERDNYTCQHCGKHEKELGKKLDVHHKIPFREFEDHKEANNMNNLIGLCASCHHTEEQRYVIEKRKDDNKC